MAIFNEDFLSRILGGQPSSGQPVNSPTPSASAIAMPTLQNAQAQDYQNAMMNRMGQLGMLLVAAGQRMTPKERATIIAQAPQYMGGIQGDVQNAAQARLMAVRAQQEQNEQARQASVDAKLSDPQYLAGLGIKPEVADAIGSEGIKKLIVNQAMANTPDALLDRQVKQAQLAKAMQPDIGIIGQDADGNPVYGDKRTGAPVSLPQTSTQAAPAAAPEAIPAGVNPREYRKKLADEQAKAKAADEAKGKAYQDEYLPAYNDYVNAFKKASEAGAIGPMQASSPSRSLFANSENENLRQQVEAAQKRWAYAQALRTYGKLDRGFTNEELNAFLQQGLPLYAANPESALEAFKGRFGGNGAPRSNPPANDPMAAARAAIQRGADPAKVRQRLIENGIDASGL